MNSPANVTEVSGKANPGHLKRSRNYTSLSFLFIPEFPKHQGRSRQGRRALGSHRGGESRNSALAPRISNNNFCSELGLGQCASAWLSHGQWHSCCWAGRGSPGLSSHSHPAPAAPPLQLAPQPVGTLGLWRDGLREQPFHLELFSQQHKVCAQLCRPSVRSWRLGLLREGGKGGKEGRRGDRRGGDRRGQDRRGAALDLLWIGKSFPKCGFINFFLLHCHTTTSPSRTKSALLPSLL